MHKEEEVLGLKWHWKTEEKSISMSMGSQGATKKVYTSPTVVLRTRQRGPLASNEGFQQASRRAPVMASGVRQLPCPYCPMRFKRRWNLNMHVHTHTGERPYQCCYCFRAFADRSNMRKHILIHTCKQPMA
ncbi:zinc finger protein SNAI3-like isoform X3 [Dermacentor albipictus]|uniref:zinc finger protein SNAI3-like isoform X3 n=1 Tax=Dermacentor albipictus TaxID=60249 RepID=UPI0031FCFE6B